MRAERVRGRIAAAAIAAACALAAGDASADRPTPVVGLGDDLRDAFTGTNLLYYGAAVGETAAMAYSGADHDVRVFFQRELPSSAWSGAAYVAGYVLPVVTAGGIWVFGLAKDDRAALGAGSAAIQALAVTVATTSLLKWATGRGYPLHGGDPNAPDRLDHPEYARDFRPFRLDGGWAWPSGHTSGFTSVVAALSAYAPDAIAIPIVGYPIALGIGVGMVDRDSHWMSDVIAGALFGYAIGSSIGRAFRRRDGRAVRAGALGRFELVPFANGGPGLGVRAVF